MLRKLFNKIGNKMLCVPFLGTQAFSFPQIFSFLATNNVEISDAAAEVAAFTEQLLDMLGALFNTWFYIIAKYILLFVDFCQVIVYKMAGIDMDMNNVLNLPVFRFVLNDTILKIIGIIFVLGLLILIVASIIAIIISEYQVAQDEKADSKAAAYKVMGKASVSLFMMVITPFILIVGIIFSSVVLSSINNVMNSNGTQRATLGGQVFVSSAYNANKYRKYAADGMRIPILFDFEDPYENGRYVDYTPAELAKIYGSWDGNIYYRNFGIRTFDKYKDTLVYDNNKLYNSSSYSEFEKFVSTPEQYFVMADFIDYAMAHELTYYIKDSRDNEVDWTNTSSQIKISDGVYDPLSKTITITYRDVSNISNYEDYYTLEIGTGTATAITPIADAVSAIMQILGHAGNVASLVGGMVQSNNKAEQIQASAMGNNGGAGETLTTSGKINKDGIITFRMLERAKGSTNVVRWATEKTIYGDQEFTVYELNKIFRNQKSGIPETKSTVKVAKKNDSIDNKYYVLKEEPNELGYYEYTNIIIDYYNDGVDYLDTLMPVYKYGTWPEKLYNDLHVIYSDIDFDNYINYDNWADALGSYFNTSEGVAKEDVSTFATTLVHPLGLIMAELFLGIAFESENSLVTDFGFTSAYLQDSIDAIVLAIGGQYNFENTKWQVEYFVDLFNSQFASVIESLHNIEGFDIYGYDDSSVQCYVYKAYLASIMTATDYGDYLYEMADTILSATRLQEMMHFGAGSVIYDQNGNLTYKIEYIYDPQGEKQPLLHSEAGTKGVYTGEGVFRYTCNSNGILDSNGPYVPKNHVKFRIEKETSGNSFVYRYHVYDEEKKEFVATNSTFFTGRSEYFEKYYTTTDNHNGTSIYVYEPKDGMTGAAKCEVEQKLYTVTQLGVEATMQEYFVYETVKKVMVSTQYQTYDKLSPNYQKVLDDIILDMESDFEDGVLEEPLYFQFLREYQQNTADMESVMGAESIDENTAEKLLEDYDEILSRIEGYEESLANPGSLSLEQIATIGNSLNLEKQKLFQLKKYYIIFCIDSYLSTKISSDFSVVVNNHPYMVSQGMTQRNLLEIVLGNKIINKTLIASLDNEADFEELNSYDQKTIIDYYGFVNLYAARINSLIHGSPTNCSLFSGELTDSELNLVNKFYELHGVYKAYTNKTLTKLGSSERTQLVETLSALIQDIDLIYNNYISGLKINKGILNSFTVSDCYKIIKSLIEISTEEETLRYVDEDYKGLLDDDGKMFGLLKDFLKDFGNLCFDISTKTNLGALVKNDEQSFIEFAGDYAELLNELLGDINFGSEINYIDIIEDAGDLKTNLDRPVEGSTKFKDLNAKSKNYIYKLYEIYDKKVKEFESQQKYYQDAKNFVQRYIFGRYAMFPDSFIYKTGVEEYLNWFRYNVDIAEDISDYVYFGYDGEVEEFEDKLYYYNLYLESFDEVPFGNKGIYFENLDSLQQQVVQDMALYFIDQYNNFMDTNEDSYQEDLLSLEMLENFIYNGYTFDGESEEDLVVGTAGSLNLGTLIEDNLNFLNLYNLLNYVGLEFSANKSLTDYRLEAIQGLIDFEERAGESGASIQSRYLSLFYIVCSHYGINPTGAMSITVDSYTKQVILGLVGLQDKAEELLVGLEYEVDNSEVVSDERYGSVYIICTYNPETEKYEPFIYASGSDSYGTPHTTYYSSPDGEIKYYPVIAKGVIDANGNPTAIREVNGYIEFYRENVTIANVAQMNLEMYYMSSENITMNYNIVNVLVNTYTKLFTGKSLAEHIIDNVPMIMASNDFNFAYGTTTNYVYHLENGAFTLNYMFYNNSGIAMNNLYNIADLNGLILVFATLAIASTMISAMFGVVRNVYEMVLLVMIYPGAFALYPLKEDPYKNWIKAFIDRALVMFGYIIAINGFFLILNILQTMEIKFTFTPENVAELNRTYVFGLFDVSAVVGILMNLAMFLVAVTLLKTLPKMFSKMVGGGDVMSRGASAQSSVNTNIEEASYFSSGYAIEDMILSKTDQLKALPLVGSDTIAAAKEKRQIKQNKAAVEAYKQRLKSSGISDATVEKAAKAYADSLQRQVDAERQRRKAKQQERNARITRHQDRVSGEKARYEKEYKKDKKAPKVCPRCKGVVTAKSKACPYCGTKL